MGVIGRHYRVMGPRRRPWCGRAQLVQHELHAAARPADEHLRLECPRVAYPADPADGLSLRDGNGGLATAAARSHFDHRAEGLMLSAQDLALDYRTGGSVAHAVDAVSLSVEQGSFVGLIGPSGSGKSSLMYLLSGLKRPTRGSVAFDGLDYGDTSTPGLIRLRRQRFGFVFQQHFLINYLSTLENVMVGAVKRNHEAVAYAQELLRRIGLGDKLRQRPYQLSIGQRQRVAVARALIHRPAVVFADEPTASLDQGTGRDVINLLADYRMRDGGGVVVVTPDPAMLTGADRVLQMRDGRVSGA